MVSGWVVGGSKATIHKLVFWAFCPPLVDSTDIVVVRVHFVWLHCFFRQSSVVQ